MLHRCDARKRAPDWSRSARPPGPLPPALGRVPGAGSPCASRSAARLTYLFTSVYFRLSSDGPALRRQSFAAAAPALERVDEMTTSGSKISGRAACFSGRVVRTGASRRDGLRGPADRRQRFSSSSRSPRTHRKKPMSSMRTAQPSTRSRGSPSRWILGHSPAQPRARARSPPSVELWRVLALMPAIVVAMPLMCVCARRLDVTDWYGYRCPSGRWNCEPRIRWSPWFFDR